MSVVLFLKVQPSSAFRLPVKTNVLTHQISSIRSDQWGMIILIWLLTRSNVRFWGVSVYLIRNQLQNGCDIVIKNVIFNQILSMHFAWRNRCIFTTYSHFCWVSFRATKYISNIKWIIRISVKIQGANISFLKFQC